MLFVSFISPVIVLVLINVQLINFKAAIDEYQKVQEPL